MGSPFYADLLDRMADDVLAGGPVGRFLADRLDTSYEEAVPLRFLGGVHRLVLDGQTPERSARSDSWRTRYEEYKRQGFPAGAPVPE